MIAFMRHSLVLVLLFVTAASAQATTYYVSPPPQGSDTNPGTAAAPFATLQKAADTVVAGDTITVARGHYDGFRIGMVAGHLGTVDNWIRMQPAPGAAVKVGPNNPNSTQATIMFRPAQCNAADPSTCPSAYWIVDGFEVLGGTTDHVVKFETGYAKLLNNKLHTSTNDIVKLARFADQVEIRGNEIYNQGGGNRHAIDIVGANDTVVARNYIHDINGVGIYTKGNAHNTLIEHNRVENVTDRAIMLGQQIDTRFLRETSGPRYESYDTIVRNNVVVNSGGACLATASSLNVRMHNNSCYNAGYSTNHAAIFVSNESAIGTAGKNVYIQNNIIHTTQPDGRAVKVGPNAMEDDRTLFIDYNIYYNPNGPVSFYWDRGAEAGLVFMGDLEQWQNYTGQNGFSRDGHSMEVDPSFQSIADLRINADSSAVDAGTGINPDTHCASEDYRAQNARPQGVGCDIGADEVSAESDVPPAADTSRRANDVAGGRTIALPARAGGNVRFADLGFLTGNQSLNTSTPAASPIKFGGTQRAPRTRACGPAARGSRGNLGVLATTSLAAQNLASGSCLRADAGQWQNLPFAAHNGLFTAQWDATPLTNSSDSLTALALGPQTFWTGLAATVRFNTAGTIDARNGEVYGALASISYIAHSTYRIRAVVNVPAQTYTVYVTPPGGTEQLLAQNYAFRSEQYGVVSLDNFVVRAETDAIEACNFATTANDSAVGQAAQLEARQ